MPGSQLLKANKQSENKNKILKNKIGDIATENINLKKEIDQLKKSNVNKNQINLKSKTNQMKIQIYCQ